VLQAIVLVGFVASVIGIVEYLFIRTDWSVQLGVPRYFGEMLNLKYPDHLAGLPLNYWLNVGNTLVRRAVSVYFSAQGFAIPFLVILPVTLYNYLKRQSRWGLIALLLCNFALFLTLTRMTILVCLMQGLIVLWLSREKWTTWLVGGATWLALLGLALTAANLRPEILNALAQFNASSTTSSSQATDNLKLPQESALDWNSAMQAGAMQDPSSEVRPGQWVTGLRLLRQDPLGQGLGTSGLNRLRFQSGVGPSGSEAGFLKIVIAMGVPGTLLYLAWFAGILAYAFIGYRELVHPYQASAALLTFVIAVGFLINNITAPPDQSLFVIYIFPWLAGLSVQFCAASQLNFEIPVCSFQQSVTFRSNMQTQAAEQ
jgi:O-Antigen ligase